MELELRVAEARKAEAEARKAEAEAEARKAEARKAEAEAEARKAEAEAEARKAEARKAEAEAEAEARKAEARKAEAEARKAEAEHGAETQTQVIPSLSLPLGGTSAERFLFVARRYSCARYLEGAGPHVRADVRASHAPNPRELVDGCTVKNS